MSKKDEKFKSFTIRIPIENWEEWIKTLDTHTKLPNHSTDNIKVSYAINLATAYLEQK